MHGKRGNALGAAGQTGAENLLLGLKASGIDYIFANAGTDFPPIIEAFATLDADSVPMAVTVPHETAGVGMAHGYYLVTGQAAGGDGACQCRAGQFDHGRHQRRQRQRAGLHDVGAHAAYRGQPAWRARDADPVRPGDVRPVLAGRQRREVSLRDALSRAGRHAGHARRHPGHERAARAGLSQPAARAADGGAARQGAPDTAPGAGNPGRGRPRFHRAGCKAGSPRRVRRWCCASAATRLGGSARRWWNLPTPMPSRLSSPS
jgi:hypothetical protein